MLNEYGHSSTKQKQYKVLSGKHLIPSMQATNLTDFRSRTDKKSLIENPYPSMMSVSINQEPLKEAGIPSLYSGRNRHDPRIIGKAMSSNQSNFFPSFDSRGNIGITDDSNEFAPLRNKMKSLVGDQPTQESAEEENNKRISNDQQLFTGLPGLDRNG